VVTWLVKCVSQPKKCSFMRPRAQFRLFSCVAHRNLAADEYALANADTSCQSVLGIPVGYGDHRMPITVMCVSPLESTDQWNFWATMRYLFFLGLPLLMSCASYRLADEPADLIAQGRQMSELVRLGWDISPPVQGNDSELPEPQSESIGDGQAWRSFISKLGRTDELRLVRNNAGIGYAIFRDGALVDMFFVTIF
jgi:hypothetical protein